jgi:hypothetical protein
VVTEQPADESSGPVVTQSVIIRRNTKDHHSGHHHCKTHRKHYHCQSGSDTSSDEEEHLMNRALRKKHGGNCSSSSDSCSGSESGDEVVKAASKKTIKDVTITTPEKTIHFHEESHSNFLEVMKRAKVKFEQHCLVLAPHNDVFNQQNFDAVERAVVAGKRTYADFVNNYIIQIRETDLAVVCSHDKAFKLVSENGVVFAVAQPNRRLLLSPKCTHLFKDHDPRLSLSHAAHKCRGYPDHVHFVTLKVLHQNFPKGI